MFDLKFSPVLKMVIFSMPQDIYLYLATLDSSGGSNAQMRWIWVAGIHKIANTVSLPLRHHKPTTMWNLWCIIAVYGASELELKVICVIANSTIFFLVASLMGKKKLIKGIHMMRAIYWKYGNSICRRTWKQSNWAAFRPSTKGKKPFTIGGLVENKKMILKSL